MIKHFVIFDRDGTLIDHVHHLSDPNLVKIKSNLIEALTLLSNNGIDFGIITNQSIINRGIASISQVQKVNEVVINFLNKSRLNFKFIYICPHTPEEGCGCRKPKLELGLKAIADQGYMTKNGFVVGDQYSDIEFGKKLGCKTIWLSQLRPLNEIANYTTSDLLDVAKWIIAEIKGNDE